MKEVIDSELLDKIQHCLNVGPTWPSPTTYSLYTELREARKSQTEPDHYKMEVEIGIQQERERTLKAVEALPRWDMDWGSMVKLREANYLWRNKVLAAIKGDA